MIVTGISTPIVLIYNHTVLLPESYKKVSEEKVNDTGDYISKSVVPYIKWKHVKPCSKYLNQQQEWNNALACASQVFTKKEMKKLINSSVPECYVISEKTPGIFKAASFNYLPGYDIGSNRFGATLGLYATVKDQPKRIFLVENYDIHEIYRHELQHHMFRILGREKEDSGRTSHTHRIWSTCEHATYEPSEKAKKYYGKRDLSKPDIVMENLLLYSNNRSRNGNILIFPFSDAVEGQDDAKN